MSRGQVRFAVVKREEHPRALPASVPFFPSACIFLSLTRISYHCKRLSMDKRVSFVPRVSSTALKIHDPSCFAFASLIFFPPIVVALGAQLRCCRWIFVIWRVALLPRCAAVVVARAPFVRSSPCTASAAVAFDAIRHDHTKNKQKSLEQRLSSSTYRRQ